jgi:hypothetical protein
MDTIIYKGGIDQKYLKKYMAAKALTWDEIVAILDALPKDKQGDLNRIFQNTSGILMSLVMLFLKSAKEEEDIVELERIKRIVNSCPIDEKFIRMKDKIWAVRQHIFDENAAHFLNKDYSALIKRDKNQAFIECLMEIAKTIYCNLSMAEKMIIFAKAKQLVEQVEKFKDLVNEPK